MSSLALSGIYSGIDTDIIVAQLLAVESRPLTVLQDRRSAWLEKQAALEEIEGRFEDLKSHLAGMRHISSLRSVLAASSDADIVTASASGTASEGVHEIVVNRLAQGEKEVHDGVAPTETWTHALGVAGADDEYLSAEQISDNTGANYKFVFQFGSEPQVEVDLSTYDLTGITLNDLAGEINTAAGYSAASAALEGGQYKLRIQAQNGGEGRALTVTDDSSVDLLDSTEDFVQTVDGSVGADTIVGAGTFVYTYNGVTRTITTTATTSLGELRDLINNDGSNPGVSASILEYEVDASHIHHLVLSGSDTGDDYAITIEGATTLAGFGASTFTQTMAAQDAQIRVDGYPADSNWIERSSNSIGNLIDGVTLNLQDTGTVTVTLTRDTAGLREDVQNLVNIYNGIVLVVNEYTGYDEGTGEGGVLQGDGGIATMVGRIRSILISTVPGFVDGTDTFTLAGHIGLNIDPDGMLGLDTSTVINAPTLADALEEDYRAVLDLLATSRTGGSTSEYIQFTAAGDGTTGGVYEVEVDFDGAGDITAARIRTKGQTEWNDATVDGNVVTGVAGKPEESLTLTVTWDGSSTTQSAEVNVRKGLAGVLYDEVSDILDPLDGAIKAKNDAYQNSIGELQTRITIQEERLAAKEVRLRGKYARLEATLARLDSFRGAFEALFTQLNSMNNARNR